MSSPRSSSVEQQSDQVDGARNANFASPVTHAVHAHIRARTHTHTYTTNKLVRERVFVFFRARTPKPRRHVHINADRANCPLPRTLIHPVQADSEQFWGLWRQPELIWSPTVEAGATLLQYIQVMHKQENKPGL